MKVLLMLMCGCLSLTQIEAQSSFKDSTRMYLTNYVEKHEVVKGSDKKYFRFYEPDQQYKVTAQFEKKENGDWFQVPTSGKMKQTYRVYGVLRFRIHDTLLQLNLYQSQNLMLNEQYKNYLFLPFTDLTTGNETYESGRYIDLSIDDIQNNKVKIDFNKSYNPYCAYVSGIYNCPIPPRENHLKIAVKAGELNYGKQK